MSNLVDAPASKLSHSFRSLDIETDKPDSKPLLLLSSTPTPTTSSSSSGSVSTTPNPETSNLADRRTRSGDLFSFSTEQAPQKNNKPTHRRSGSVPVIYTGSNFGYSTSSNGATSSATASQLPAGNICPSGRVVTGIMPRGNAKSDVLGSGTVNYGHGNIIRGGGKSMEFSASDESKILAGIVPRTSAKSDVLGSGSSNYGHGSVVRGGWKSTDFSVSDESKILAGIVPRGNGKSDVLGSGTGNYGHGSVVRGGGKSTEGLGSNGSVVRGGGKFTEGLGVMGSGDVEEVKRVGNEMYKRGMFVEALRVYDKAIEMCPESGVCRSNRAAALIGLGRFGEAVKECEEAVRIDPGFGRAHLRLGSLYIRLGQIENARKHLAMAGTQPDPVDLQKLQVVERHLNRCAESRKVGDWKSVLRESDMAIVEGADSSPLLLASKAEALLRTHRIEDADSALSNALKLERSCVPCSNTKFYGMESSSYLYFVQSQLDMALGRFDNAVAAAEKARQIDSVNVEIKMMLSNAKIVTRSRSLGNELFNSGKFAEACLSYGEGLKYDPSNPVLFCNRAACRLKIGQWQKAIDDCNEALRIHPNYTKALLRRAASYCKLEQWTEAVKDYEVLRKEFPGDTEVAEALFHAQVALKTSRGEEVSNLKFGGEVEEITGVQQFKAAIALPGVSVVHFMTASNHNCNQITPFVNTLCTRYPSVNFLKVDVNEIPAVAKLENVRIVPTFKIYKNGTRVKEMVCPSQQVLDNSVRHYGF